MRVDRWVGSCCSCRGILLVLVLDALGYGAIRALLVLLEPRLAGVGGSNSSQDALTARVVVLASLPGLAVSPDVVALRATDRVFVGLEVRLVDPGTTSVLTGLEQRQKPKRLIHDPN